MGRKQSHKTEEELQAIKDANNQRHVCEICKGSYTTVNKTHHDATQKHQMARELHDTIKKLMMK